MKHTRRLQNLQRFGGDEHRRGQFTKIMPKVRVILKIDQLDILKLNQVVFYLFISFIQEYRQVFVENCFGKYSILLELCVESTDILNRQTIQQTADLRSMEPTTRQPEADLIRCLLNCMIHNVRFNPDFSYFLFRNDFEPQNKLSKIDQLAHFCAQPPLLRGRAELCGKIKLCNKCLPVLIVFTSSQIYYRKNPDNSSLNCEIH